MHGLRRSQITTAALIAVSLLASTAALGQDARTWIGKHAELEEYIRNAEVESVEEIGTGVTNPLEATLKAGGPVARIAFKPIKPGRYLGHFESYKYEIAAYELDKHLGLDMKPPTVEKRIEGDLGAAVMWAESAKTFGEFGGLPQAPPAKAGAWNRQVVRAKMFQNMIGDTDPNLGNWLFDGDWNVILIDHTRAFGSSPKGVHAMKRFDRELWEKIKVLDEATISSVAGDWLTKREIKSIIKRIARTQTDIDKLIAKSSEDSVFLAPAS